MKESQICIALDFQTKNEVENFLDQFLGMNNFMSK